MKLTTARVMAHARAFAHVAAAAAVLVACVAADLAAMAFDLGRQTGAAIHARNNQLAALASSLHRPPIAAIPEPKPLPVAETAAPLLTAAELKRLTVRELRDLTGARSKRLRKADLVALALG